MLVAMSKFSVFCSLIALVIDLGAAQPYPQYQGQQSGNGRRGPPQGQFGNGPPPQNRCQGPKEAYTTLQAHGAGSVSGWVQFREEGPGQPVHITGEIRNLADGAHGFHIHTYGLGADDACTATGGHFNPQNVNHGAPTNGQNARHVGDLGNINSSGGVARIDMYDSIVKLGGPSDIVGRAVVVHAGQDDFGLGGKSDSLTTGAAGGRLACGNIYLKLETC